MSRLLNNDGTPVEIIGGTTAYVTIRPAVAGIVNGNAVALPVSYDVADMSGCLISPNGVVKEFTLQRGADGAAVAVVTPGVSSLGQTQTMDATLEIKAVLTTAIPNTSYLAGDTLGFRWNVYLMKPLAI